jgi:diguanylate cyclase (GGDEF)-like protein
MATGKRHSVSSAWLDRFSTGSTWIVICGATSVLIGIDRAFPEVGMGPAYIPLIALAAWRLGLVPACAVAGIATFLNIYLHGADGVVSPAVALARGALRFSTYAFIVASMCALRRLYDRERTAARRDYLTGALARVAFDERAAVLSTAVLQGSGALALVLIDVDGFKGINDRHGHAAGDDTLQALVRTAAVALRPGDCLGRIGGDEFAAALHAATSDEAQQTVSTFHRVLSHGLSHAAVPATVSMGACILVPGADANAETAMREADRSMYEAKAAGPGGVRVHVLSETLGRIGSAACSMVPSAA